MKPYTQVSCGPVALSPVQQVHSLCLGSSSLIALQSSWVFLGLFQQSTTLMRRWDGDSPAQPMRWCCAEGFMWSPTTYIMPISSANQNQYSCLSGCDNKRKFLWTRLSPPRLCRSFPSITGFPMFKLIIKQRVKRTKNKAYHFMNRPVISHHIIC